MQAGSEVTPKRFEREIGSTRAEFVRALGLAHPRGVENPAENVFRVSEGGVVLEISLSESPPRRIGLFVIPVLNAVYEFRQGAPANCAALLGRLDLAMQRGGG